LFASVLLAAALLPVSAMPSRNHLYLGTAAVSLLIAATLGSTGRHVIPAGALLLGIVAGSIDAIVSSHDWAYAAAMTRQAATVMGPSLEPCGTRQVLLMIAPANLHGVPCNLNNEVFREYLACAPGQVFSFFRVVGSDVRVSLSRSAGQIQIRVPDYIGNLMGTTDLRHFTVQIPPGVRQSFDTPLGSWGTWAEQTTQVLEVNLDADARGLPLFCYSGGSVQRVGGPMAAGALPR
jgi:hypothetical protein